MTEVLGVAPKENVACSDCFEAEGLRVDAAALGNDSDDDCPCCGRRSGKKLTRGALEELAYRYFVVGTTRRARYGAAPTVQFNTRPQGSSIQAPPWLRADILKFEQVLGIGFFYYGPRLWMVGEVEPLKALQEPSTRDDVIKRLLAEYPSIQVGPDLRCYRIRKSPRRPHDPGEYDSPPSGTAGKGRFDSAGFPVLYTSPDLELCVHECRTTVEDSIFAATLAPAMPLKLLNLAALLREDTTEFESLDIAVHFLFLAGSHSYDIARAVGLAARNAGFDGIVYPSYFSLMRTGAEFMRTTYGMSHRMIANLQPFEERLSVPNLAVFGRPISEKRMLVRSIERVVIRRTSYEFHFGPVGVDPTDFGDGSA